MDVTIPAKVSRTSRVSSGLVGVCSGLVVLTSDLAVFASDLVGLSTDFTDFEVFYL